MMPMAGDITFTACKIVFWLCGYHNFASILCLKIVFGLKVVAVRETTGDVHSASFCVRRARQLEKPQKDPREERKVSTSLATALKLQLLLPDQRHPTQPANDAAPPIFQIQCMHAADWQEIENVSSFDICSFDISLCFFPQQPFMCVT
jgi:hypothetical protein